MSEKKFVTYLEFGAKGDGKTNDFEAIKRAHDYANEHNLPVKIEGDNRYYIGDSEIDGKAEIIVIKTDVDWGNATIVIDDNVFPLTGINVHGRHYMHVFRVDSDYEMITIRDKEILDRIVKEGFNKSSTKVNLGLGYPAMIIPHNDSARVYRRKGYGGHLGYDAKEVVVIDKDGNFDPEIRLLFDYDNLDAIDVFRIDIRPLTLRNGTFITLANHESTVLYNEDGTVKGRRDLYFKRGINVNRSFTTVKNVKHYVEGQITPREQAEEGKLGVGYYGFFATTLSTNVTYEDCIVTARRCFSTEMVGLRLGTQGSYDIHCELSNKVVFKNCIQSNFWINDEGEAVPEGTPGAKISMSSVKCFPRGARTHWGIGGSNDCKNIEYHGCTLSRFDAHRGLYNGKIIDSTVNCIALVGGGHMQIENVRWFSEGSLGNYVACGRSDYGSPWEGSITVKNFKAYPDWSCPFYVFSHAYVNWYYGYTCRLPYIEVENLELYDENGNLCPKGTEINLFNHHRTILREPALHLPETMYSHPFYTDYSGANRGGIEDTESFKNLNMVVPPEKVKVTKNVGEYAYVVPNTYEYKGLGENGFFEKTKFYYSDTEYYEGTNHKEEKTESYKFITVE